MKWRATGTYYSEGKVNEFRENHFALDIIRMLV